MVTFMSLDAGDQVDDADTVELPQSDDVAIRMELMFRASVLLDQPGDQILPSCRR